MNMSSQELIAFFFLNEDKSFWGYCYECSSDHPDLQDSWMTYIKPNYYPDFQKWFSLSSSTRSCYVILQVSSPWHSISLKNLSNELTDACPSVQEDSPLPETYSLSVLDGVVFFFFYEQPQFRRLQHLLQPGKYRQFSDWGTMTARVGSFQPTLDIS
uniref:Crystallin gamma A n=1 Tax=Anas platyrhynchos TaxID=8839 RepID=A0A8B9SQ38_ANAPL